MKYEMQELKNINRLFNKFNKQVDEFIKEEKRKNVARNRGKDKETRQSR